jgi:hypothetical protein
MLMPVWVIWRSTGLVVLTTPSLLLLLQVGLLGPDGADLPLHLEGKGAVGSSTVLRCDAEHNTFTFTDVTVRQAATPCSAGSVAGVAAHIVNTASCVCAVCIGSLRWSLVCCARSAGRLLALCRSSGCCLQCSCM